MKSVPPNPSGLCMCGCGQPTPLAVQTNNARGLVKGEPVRYIQTHSRVRTPVEFVEHAETNCWVWQRVKNHEGYGKIGNTAAHVVYYREFVGPIPEGKHLDHLCSNRACVNPGHLEPVTPGENVRRSRAAKLNWDAVAEIRANPHLPRAVFVRRFGVSPYAISCVRTEKTWPEAERPKETA